MGIGLLAGPTIAVVAPASPAAATTTSTFKGPYQRISQTPSGGDLDASARMPVLSADGSVLLFASDASNVVPDDTNGTHDMFLHDRSTGTTERVDVSSSGEQADLGLGPYVYERGSVSDDARFVAFSSRATNLVAGDTNAKSDVFLRDRTTQTTTRVSTTATGDQVAGMSWDPSLSPDGRYLTFTSASSLVPEDTDAVEDVYLKDTQTGAVTLVSAGMPGSAAGGVLSADTRYVVFSSGSKVHRRDLQTSTTAVVVAAVDGGPLEFGAFAAGISADGNRMIVQSRSSNLTPNDPEGDDAYFVDVAAGVLTRLTEAVPGSGTVWDSAISRDGTVLTYNQINHPFLVHHVDEDAVIRVVSSGGATFNHFEPTLSADGTVLAFGANDGIITPPGADGRVDLMLAELVSGEDATAPDVSCGAPDGVWHADNVSVSCTASDAGSGLADPADASFELSTAVAAGSSSSNASVTTRNVCDVAGNCRTAASPGHQIDRKAPTVAVDDASKGTFVRGAEVPAAFSCDDGADGSGVSSCIAEAAGTPVDAGDLLPTDDVVDAEIVVDATDGVGLTGSGSGSFVVTDDALTGRITRPNGSPVSGASVRLWPAGAEEPSVFGSTAADGTYRFDIADSGAGSFTVQVIKDGFTDAWHDGEDQQSAVPVRLGLRPVTVDATLTVAPGDDVTAPLISCNPGPGGSVVASDNVFLACTVTDDVALADPADSTFSLATSVADGAETSAALTGTRVVCDTSDNCASAGPFGPFRVDRKAPVVTIYGISEGQQFPPGVTISWAFDCTDLHLVSCSSTSPRPTPVTTAGTHTVTATALDGAGRETVLTRTYTVVATTLRGVVIDNPWETPISGALVEVWAFNAPRTGPPTATTTTSANGAWSIPNLEPNAPYFARYSKAGYETRWHGGSTTWETATLIGGPSPQSQVFTGWLRAVDTKAPVVSCSPPSASAWRPTQVTVGCTATDDVALASPNLSSFTLITNVPAETETASAATSTQQVCDTSGNCTTAGPYLYKIDRKAPTYTCPSQSPSWTATERSATCTGADGGSGPPSGSFVLSTNVGAGNYNASASTNPFSLCDFLGNCRTAQLTGLRVDRAPPVATCGTPPTTWFSGNQSVPCSPSDPGVGYSGATTVIAVTTVAVNQETANASASVLLCDTLNNCAPKTVPGFKIDRKGPVVTCGAADGVWHNANVSIGCTHSDGGVGLPLTYSPFPPFIINQPYPVNFSASTSVASGAESATAAATSTQKCDLLNNCTGVSVANNKIDRKAPTSTCPAVSTQWSGANVSITCTVADGGSGSDWTTYSPSTSVADGTETASATMATTSICDRMNNCANLGGPGPWKIDRKAPTASCSTAPASGTVRDDEVTLTCTASDAGSGLASAGDASFTRETTVGAGAEATVTIPARSVCDATGACTVLAERGPYGIDRKAPEVAITSPSADQVVVFGTPVTADFACSDLFLTSCTASTPNGEALPGSVGTHTLEVTGTDQVGRATTVSRSYTVIRSEDTPPTVSCTVPSNSTTWRSSQVTGTCTASDVSGLALPELASFPISTAVADGADDPAAATVPVEVCDVQGNCTTTGALGSYRIDRKGPVATCAPISSAWSKVNLSSRCTGADTGAGVVTSAAFTVATTVGVGEWNGDASTTLAATCDKVGNCTPVQFQGLKVDRVGPEVTCGPVPTTWSSTNVSVSCTPDDPGVGYTGAATVNAVSAVALKQESDAADAKVTVCDLLGNCTTKVLSGAKVDRLAPSVSCAAPDGAWHANNVSLPCQQSDGGSGLAPSSPNGGGDFSAVTNLAAATSSASVAATAAPSCDNVGNCRSVSVPGNKIDRKAPSATCPADLTWHADNVTVTCPVVDAGAGPVSDTWTSATTVAAGLETRTAKLTKAPLCDLVGNCVDYAPGSLYKVDRRAPKITVTAPKTGKIWVLGTIITPAYTCTDGGSGLVSCTAPAPSGSLYTLSATGSVTFPVVAVDEAGNRATVDVALTVRAPISGRITDNAGVGIEGVSVSRYAATGNAPAIETVLTDADGSYQFVHVSPGSYRFGAVKPGAYLQRWNAGTTFAAAVPVAFDGSVPKTLPTLKLPAASGLSGTVTSSETGLPLAGVQVAISSSASATAVPILVVTTDDEGRWSALDLPAGTYRYQLVAPGYRSEWHTDATLKSGATPIVLAAGDRSTGLVDVLTAVS